MHPWRTPAVGDTLAIIMADGWPPLEAQPWGPWILRASAGFTSRGNSVLVSGRPPGPLPSVLDHVEHWYAARGLPALLAVPTDAALRPVDGALVTALVDRGYDATQPTVTMTAPSRVVAAGPGQGRTRRGIPRHAQQPRRGRQRSRGCRWHPGGQDFTRCGSHRATVGADLPAPWPHASDNWLSRTASTTSTSTWSRRMPVRVGAIASWGLSTTAAMCITGGRWRDSYGALAQMTWLAAS
ncbi:MAG: hypothetical protein V9F04_05960 [Dermatophilaceae bacterium]